MSDYIETKVGKYIIRKYNEHEEWRVSGRLHREDGPAFKCSNGTEYWYLNGKPNRVDGPAIKYDFGYEKWYLNNSFLLKEEYKLIPILYRINIIYE